MREGRPKPAQPPARVSTETVGEGYGGWNFFGGFTLVEWESRTKFAYHKDDPSLKNFLFTGKNLHNFPARKFPLKAAKKREAILCDSSCGSYFWDIVVSDNCDANTDSRSYLGCSYANAIGLEAGRPKQIAVADCGAERFDLVRNMWFG
jgi:hypothetical protein